MRRLCRPYGWRHLLNYLENGYFGSTILSRPEEPIPTTVPSHVLSYTVVQTLNFLSQA